MGRLFDLIQAHIDAQPYEVSYAQVAEKVGVSRQTLLNWRTPTKLIRVDHLQGIARVTGVPYQRVLDALLEDIGYLHPGVQVGDEPASTRKASRRTRSGQRTAEQQRRADLDEVGEESQDPDDGVDPG